MTNLFNFSPQIFGIDISNLSLKIVQLKKKKSFLYLSSYNETKIKEGALSLGEIEKEEELIESIKKTVKNAQGEKIKTKYVVASLPEEKAFLQIVSLPKIEEEKIKEAISLEIENYIPLPQEEIDFDVQIIESSKDLDHLDVLIFAIPKKISESYLNILKKSNLEPVAFEIESQAVARAVVKNETTNGPILILDLGATRTGLNIYSGNSLRFTTSISVCGETFTRALVNHFKISEERAEKLKRRYGLKDEKIFEAFTPALTDLLEQIIKWIEYYKNHDFHEHSISEKKIKKILLCGGGANMKGLEEFFISQLECPTEKANPWINVFPEKIKKIPPITLEESLGFTTAIGLALRGIKEEPYEIR